VTIALTDDSNITAKGRVRQVDPQANPVTHLTTARKIGSAEGISIPATLVIPSVMQNFPASQAYPR
jgi:hypothetical protein